MPVGTRIKFWYFILIIFVAWIFLLAAYFSGNHPTVHSSKSTSSVQIPKTEHSKTEPYPVNSTVDNFFIGGEWDKYLQQVVLPEPARPDPEPENRVAGSDPCSGKYIYVHEIPSSFNSDVLLHCRTLSKWMNMCPYLSNLGLGPQIPSPEKSVLNSGWYETNQFVLEVIFHNRMKQYKCLTRDSAKASAVFVPYYAGLEVARYLWSNNRLMRDHYSLELIKWIRSKPEWRKMFGRDHFMVAGRISWDFRRLTEKDDDWGNKLMVLPESKNMTMLTIESSPWNDNDFGIPYPTDFHPSSDSQVFEWQRRMKKIKRRILFSFAGAPRPNLRNSIRNEIIEQCKSAKKKCQLLGCQPGSKKCDDPSNLLKMFQSSVFCLQPPGDSYTRRSTFDSILAGCIPVFFHPGSAYVQYLWHFPRDYTKYSVFIPGNEIKEGKANIEKILSRISKQRVVAMREQVIKLIPGVIYADPRGNLETLEDAFDITVEGVLERIEEMRKDLKEGKNLSVTEQDEEMNWKKSVFGSVRSNPWDHFFIRENEWNHQGEGVNFRTN
ncbi:Probable xyloglucan galactosyltransferase GT11 [Linum perenne]